MIDTRRILCFFFGHKFEPPEKEFLLKDAEPPVPDYSECPKDAQPNLLVTFHYISSLWKEHECCSRCGHVTSSLKAERSKTQYYQMSFLREGHLYTKLPRLLRRGT